MRYVMKYDCIFLNAEPIGGIPEENLIQWGYECQCPDLPRRYNEDIDCEKCKHYEANK